MFRNYLAAALRNLVRNRLYAAINIVGLAVGLTAAILIGLFVRDEFGYDSWLPDHARLYRVSASVILGDKAHALAFAPLGAADPLKQEFPEIEAYTRFTFDAPRSVRNGNIEGIEQLYWADPNLLDVLRLPVLAGNPATALRDPDGAVFTRAMARKYFGEDMPLGKTFEIARSYTAHVTAVVDDLPSNTSLALGIVLSGLSSRAPDQIRDPSKPNSAAYLYVRLRPGISGDHLRAGLKGFNDRHPEFRAPNYALSLDRVDQIGAIHFLPADIVGTERPPGNVATAFAALIIAILVVAVAAVNFVNLSTARAIRRAVEVGVRKASGALRWHLVLQFIGESVGTAVLAMALAILGAVLLLPAFNAFLDRGIKLQPDATFISAVLGVVAVAGLAAGCYPAFILSRFSPARVLKGSMRGQLRGGRGRTVLVSAQFAVLIALALVAITVHRQVDFAVNGALRFRTDQMLLIEGAACQPSFVEAVRALPGVRAAVCSDRSILAGNFPADVQGPDGTKASPGEDVVDAGYLDLYGVKPIAGRFFSQNIASDSWTPTEDRPTPISVVINESLSRALGFTRPEHAIGQVLRWKPRSPGLLVKIVEGPSTIIGIAPDYSRSAREPVVPLIYDVNTRALNVLNVKLDGTRIPETLAGIDRLWKGLAPAQHPIVKNFLDRQVEALYRDVTRLGDTVAAFAIVAVFIACLGLFGLAALTAELRTKEIGVRKALGAGMVDILRLMLWEFARPVLWASTVAWPVAFLVARHWLEGFAARVDLALWTFPAVTAIALLIATVTILGHALLVARAQPVAALRYE